MSNMGLEGEKKEFPESGDEREGNVKRTMSDSSLDADDDEDDEGHKIELGPQYTLKEQLEKDKDDESLRKWKEQLLGSVDVNSVGETLEPDVTILSLAILSPGRPDIVLPIPADGKPKGSWFTLKEGCPYSLKFSFQVSNNIVSGLKYTNTVWKTGMKVDNSKEMLGTFSPQQEPYTHVMPEETTPSGFLQEERVLHLRSLLTTITNATWRSTTHSISRRIGPRLKRRPYEYFSQVGFLKIYLLQR